MGGRGSRSLSSSFAAAEEGFSTPTRRPTTVANNPNDISAPLTLNQRRHYARNKELYRAHAAPIAGGDIGHQHTGIADLQVGFPKAPLQRECGNLPRTDMAKYDTAIPKYGGDIPKKYGGNLRFRDRAVSGKHAFMARSKGLKVVPFVPGFQGHHPGVGAETVYGSSMGKASYKAQYLRERNPWCSLRARQRDPSVSLQYQRLIPGTQLRQDLSLANLPEEDAFARQYAAFETKVQPHELATMGWTKYISAPNTGLSYDPKYSISKNNNNDNKNRTRVGHGGGGKGDNNKMRQAGMSSHKSSAQLEAQRWQHQMWFSRDPACGSSTLGAMIRP